MNINEIVSMFTQTMNDLADELYTGADRIAYRAAVQRVATEYLWARLHGATPGDLEELYTDAEHMVDRSACGANP